MTAFYSCSKENPLVEEENLPIVKIELPQISINTNGAEIVDEPKIRAEMLVSLEDVIDFSGTIGIEIRGSSSQMFPKKQYGVETRDEDRRPDSWQQGTSKTQPSRWLRLSQLRLA